MSFLELSRSLKNLFGSILEKNAVYLTIIFTYDKKASMDKSKIKRNLTSYDVENKVESFHWWFAVRRKLIKSIISSIHIPLNHFVLDIGCGAGSNLKVLLSSGIHAIGIDRSIYILSLLSKKIECPLVNGDLTKLPIRANSVGLIIAMDILEHLDDDAKGINEFYRVLIQGGIIFITVPAFTFLWGIQDIVTGHKRRYSRKEILKKLRGAGFDILKSSYFNFILFPLILLARRLIRLLGLKIESENKINFPLINFFLKSIFSLEVYLLKYISFPFGVSFFCIARKR
jgi:ubiquinone/menaquinone biosynthesis C-methylase UbiE